MMKGIEKIKNKMRESKKCQMSKLKVQMKYIQGPMSKIKFPACRWQRI
jgi:translation initiation factor 2 alpha subunit (eIF-2alpha)